MKDIVIIGAGGLGREVAWLIEDINQDEKVWNILGFVDDNLEQGKVVNGYKVLGNSMLLNNKENLYYVCAIANVNDRKVIIERLKRNPLIKAATLIHPSARIAYKNSHLEEGCIVCSGSVISVNCNIGEFNIIDWNCTIGHDVLTKDFVTLYPEVCVSGCCTINNCVEIGTGAKIIQGKSIGENTIIGAGAVVINDLKDNITAVGVPAKVKNKAVKRG